MSLTFQVSVPSPRRHHPISLTKPFIQTFLQTTCVHKQFLRLHSNRRSTVIGISLLIALTPNQGLMAGGVPENGLPQSRSHVLPEFGSEPRSLAHIIRVVVPRPKRSETGDETLEVLKVEGVEVPNDDAVRFDVYVNKLDGDDQVEVGSDLGEFVGSFFEENRLRSGNHYRKRGLNLGITNLMREIGGDKCEKLVVSLVPRTGELSIGGVLIDRIQPH